MSSPATRVSAAPALDALGAMLRPSSIAVIGASADPTKRGHRAIRALRNAGFPGRIIPVNPAGGELLGCRVARGPHDLDAPADLALVATPAATVPAVLRDWARAGTRGAVVLASGFGETGSEGAALENAIRDVVAETGIRVIGPNTSGILNVPLGLNLIGIDGVRSGGSALLVQSGNLALALLTEAAHADVGFSFVIGVGNEVDLGFAELLEFLAADEATRAIGVHAEGFRDGAAFLAAARRAAAMKPVVVLKGARSEGGGASARSHTGAVAGSYAALSGGLAQAGVIEVRRSDEMLPVLTTLGSQALSSSGSGGLAILSDGGGHATLAVDDLHDRGAALRSLHADTSHRLRTLLGVAASVTNPIDLAGAADRDPIVFARALDIVAGDADVDAILVLGLFGGYAIRFSETLHDAEVAAAHEFVRIAHERGTGLIVHSLYARADSEPLRILRRGSVPVIESLEAACHCASALLRERDMRRRVVHARGPWPAGSAAAHSPHHTDDVLRQARSESRRVLLEPEARALMAPFGLRAAPAELCRDAAEVARAADRIGGPVAIRIVSPGTPHKSEAGGVALNVIAADAYAAAERMIDSVRAWCSARGQSADIRGLLVGPMLDAPIAELLVGVVRDPQFGPVLSVGAGGTRVELERDVATRVLPVSETEITGMLASLRIAPLLAGYRGAQAADMHAVVRAVLAVAGCALAYSDLTEVEVNPLFVYNDRAIAIDVRVFID